jgi:hypothetical protein
MQLTRWFRKYERTILVVLTVLLATSFGAGYGVPNAVGQFVGRLLGRTSPVKTDALAQVSGRSVSAEEFGPFYVRWARFPFGVEKEEQAWTVYASVALARELGVRVSDEEMREFVLTARPFFDDPTNPEGHYSYAKFQAVLAQSRMTQEDFEETLREFLSMVKLRQCLLGSMVVTSAEVWPLYREEHTSYDVTAVRFPTDAFLAQVPEPSTEEVSTWYEKEKERRYREPQRIRVELLAAPYAGFAAEVKVTEEEARQYYDAHPQEFAAPAEPAAGQAAGAETAPQAKPFAEARDSILERLRLEQAQAEAQRAVEDAQRKLQADPQATMSSIADASSGKLQAAASEFFSPVEVGKVPLLAASFDPWDQFIASLFNPKTGQQGPVNEVGLGREAAVLCRVLDRQPSRVLSLEEAREKVVADLKHTRAVEHASQEALALADELKEKKQTLDSPLVRDRGLTVETPAAFTVAAKDAPAYATHLFGAKPGAILTAPGGDAMYVVEVRDTHAPTWEEFQRAPQQEKADLQRTYRSWITPRWDELVRREVELKVFPKKGATEATEEPPADEGAGGAPPAPETKAGEPSQPPTPSPQSSTNPVTP